MTKFRDDFMDGFVSYGVMFAKGKPMRPQTDRFMDILDDLMVYFDKGSKRKFKWRTFWDMHASQQDNKICRDNVNA